MSPNCSLFGGFTVLDLATLWKLVYGCVYVQVMQNASNLQEEMEAKEPFMHPMNCVMPESVARVKTFIQSLVQIDQKEGGCVQSHDTAVMSREWHCRGVVAQCRQSEGWRTVVTSITSSCVRDFCGRGTRLRPVEEVFSIGRDTSNSATSHSPIVRTRNKLEWVTSG